MDEQPYTTVSTNNAQNTRINGSTYLNQPLASPLPAKPISINIEYARQIGGSNGSDRGAAGGGETAMDESPSPSDMASATTPTDRSERGKPKQKRNKPTLSCEECVERKTKCDRGRLSCLACIKRQSQCTYTQVANLIASTKRTHGEVSKARFVTKPPAKGRALSSNLSATSSDHIPVTAGAARLYNNNHHRPLAGSSESPHLWSQLPFTKSAPSNVFRIGDKHPFSNYWTCSGGIAEVISILPNKEQADILLAKYFEAVDPVYPFLHRRTFQGNYERYWALPPSARLGADADMIALHCAVYALATQFMHFPSYEERTSSAEFYASAANQALRVYSYLGRTSMRAVAAMVLLAYFLMNDNHASDAYAWAGIVLRQAYAMRLHRDPDLVYPDSTEVDKQARRKLWQAVFFQDTFLTILLRLPPTATHSDCGPESLMDETQMQAGGHDIYVGVNSRVENLMSINVIAPQESTAPPHPVLPRFMLDPAVDKADVEYIRCMWRLGNLVQESIASPLSLSLPLANSPRQKTSLISSFRTLYNSFPANLTTLDLPYLERHALHEPRSVKQNLFLTSNYYHCLMILEACEYHEAGVERDTLGTLEAAHESIWAFFKFIRLFEPEAGVWWTFQHRAFEEALVLADILSRPPSPGVDFSHPLFSKCKDDIMQMHHLLQTNNRSSLEMQKTRMDVLQAALERVIV